MKTRVFSRSQALALLGGVSAVLAGTVASAAPVVSISDDVQSGPDNVSFVFAVSSTDLIEGLSPTAASDLGLKKGSEGTNPNPAVLTDGDYGPGGVRPVSAAWEDATYTMSNSSTSAPSPSILYYSLDLSAAPQGYDITGIDTYSLWVDQNRNAQYYMVSYATVSDPATFVSLASVVSTRAGNVPTNRKVSISISDLTNVAAIKFDFTGANGNDYVGYRELDVIGAASVPEPGTLGVLAIGGLALLGRRRRMA